MPNHSNCTTVAQSTVVPQVTQSHSRLPIQNTYISKATQTTKNPPSVPHTPREVTLTRLEAIKHQLTKRGFSEKVILKILHRHRKNTGALYESKWQSYLHWCNQRQIDPLHPTEVIIADFLLYLFEDKKLCPATVTGYRTVLAQTFKFFTDLDFSIINNDCLSALIQNFRISCPAARFKTPSWDLALVLRALSKHPFEPIISIPFNLLTFKTAFLVLLASGARASEIHALSFKEFSRALDWSKVYLKPSDQFLAKNQPSRAPEHRRHFCIPALTDFSTDSADRYLCPVRALRIYMSKSQPYRKHKKLLFIAINKNYTKDITKNTFAGYVKQAILRAYKCAGEVDIRLSQCRVHDVRALSASLAFRYNVALDTILQCCSWKSDLVFTNFYLRDLAIQSAELYKLPSFVCAQQKLRNKAHKS